MRNRSALLVLSLLVGTGSGTFALALDPPQAVKPNRLAPFVTSPVPVVDRMLEVAGLKNSETVYDLGCGDGRILFSAAKNFGAKAVGVEISEKLVKEARDRAESMGLQEQVKVIQGDMLQVDLRNADVVALYLMTEANDQLRPKLERELKPGARVVSLEFKIQGWKPVKVDKIETHHHPYMIYLYEVGKKK